MLQVVHERCAGLDIHKKTVVACVLVSKPDGQVQHEVRTFGTTTHEILALAQWLKGQGVSSLAMESTGVYWIPVYNLLEGSFELLVVNAQHMKAVPGRKTDVSDAEWMGQLHRHGLLQGSFIPPKPQRQLRELVRHRTNVVERRSQSVNELQKVLEGASIKLASVVSEITGVSALEMVGGLIDGEHAPEVLAELARGRLRDKKGQLAAALTGRLEKHHRFILSQLLADISFCEEQIAELDQQIREAMQQYEELIERLDAIPGVNRRIAEVLVAEVGRICAALATRPTWYRGPGCVRAITKAGASGACGGSEKGFVFFSPIPPPGCPAGQKARQGRRGTLDSGDGFPPDRAWHHLPGPGRQLL